MWNSNATLRPILDHLLQRAGLLPVRMQIGLANGGVPNTSISVSSAEKGFPKESVRLSNKGGWCGAESESGSDGPFQGADRLRGFRTPPVLRGSSGVAFASSIRLQYADDADDLFREYKSPEGAPVEFRIPEETSIAEVNLPTAVEAHYFRLVIQDYSVAPCLRMEMMACTRSECLDVDECANGKNGDCQQKCVNNPGGFAYSCDQGYDLFDENGTAGFHIPGIGDGRQGRRPLPTRQNLRQKNVSGCCSSAERARPSHHFGYQVKFHCRIGFVMVGSAAIHCTAGGTWNASAPECQPAQCVPLAEDQSEV